MFVCLCLYICSIRSRSLPGLARARYPTEQQYQPTRFPGLSAICFFIGGLPRVLFLFERAAFHTRSPLLLGVPLNGILGWTYFPAATSPSCFAHAASHTTTPKTLESASLPTCRRSILLHSGASGLTGYCIRATVDTIASVRMPQVRRPSASHGAITSFSRQWHSPSPHLHLFGSLISQSSRRPRL